MRTPAQSRLLQANGSALVTAMVFCFVGSVMLASILVWTKNQGRLSARQSEYIRTQYVAEAGAEKVFSAIRSQLASTGQALNQAACDVIATNSVPTSADNAMFANYRYVDSGGTSNKITVTVISSAAVNTISAGTYAGLYAITSPYRIIARADGFNRPEHLTTGIQRDLEIENIPIFQFAVFYQGRLEVLPGPVMTITGRVHCNSDSYISPLSGLTVQDNVTSVGLIAQTPPPELLYSGSPYLAPRATPVFNGSVTANSPALSLPIQASNPHDIVEPPPTSGSDPISSQRLYNQAGLRIRVSNSGITVTDGSGNAVTGVTVANGSISTNKTLYNHREGKTITMTEINLSTLIANGKMPSNGIIYIDDTRTSPQETAVRLINGSSLPTAGLSVVTPNPMYIKGDFNSTADRPSAIFADAINILSGNWSDSNAANSSSALSSRVANNTTVNAAFFTGNVPTTGTTYSGGLENLPRFLEDWSGKTLTYAGSMVCMFPSETATGSQANSSYSAPTRNWSFDTQFLNSSTLPPGTPSLRTITRTAWAAVQ